MAETQAPYCQWVLTTVENDFDQISDPVRRFALYLVELERHRAWQQQSMDTETLRKRASEAETDSSISSFDQI